MKMMTPTNQGTDMAKAKKTHVGPQDLPPDVLKALKAVIDYNWEAELEDASDVGPEGHVFSSLVTLNNFVTGKDNTPESYLTSDDDDDDDEEDEEEDEEDES